MLKPRNYYITMRMTSIIKSGFYAVPHTCHPSYTGILEGFRPARPKKKKKM
jgi:hypothetical protein